MPKVKKLPLRPNVCMLVHNAAYKLWLGERHNEPGIWQFPQGGVEKKLTLEENVLRELHEELGAEKKFFQIARKLNSTNEYDFSKIPDYAVDKYRGQSQTFWIVSFTGKDSDFKLDRYEPEFMNFRWCSVDEVRKKAEPKRVKGYEGALKEYSRYLETRL